MRLLAKGRYAESGQDRGLRERAGMIVLYMLFETALDTIMFINYTRFVHLQLNSTTKMSIPRPRRVKQRNATNIFG
jgi:hypothetical protein